MSEKYTVYKIINNEIKEHLSLTEEQYIKYNKDKDFKFELDLRQYKEKIKSKLTEMKPLCFDDWYKLTEAGKYFRETIYTGDKGAAQVSLEFDMRYEEYKNAFKFFDIHEDVK